MDTRSCPSRRRRFLKEHQCMARYREEDPNGEDDDVIERGVEREVIEVVPRAQDEKKH